MIVVSGKQLIIYIMRCSKNHAPPWLFVITDYLLKVYMSLQWNKKVLYFLWSATLSNRLLISFTYAYWCQKMILTLQYWTSVIATEIRELLCQKWSFFSHCTPPSPTRTGFGGEACWWRPQMLPLSICPKRRLQTSPSQTLDLLSCL